MCVYVCAVYPASTQSSVVRSTNTDTAIQCKLIHDTPMRYTTLCAHSQYNTRIFTHVFVFRISDVASCWAV